MRVAIFTDTFSPQINGVSNTIKNMAGYFEEKDINYKLFVPKYDNEKGNHNIERFYSLKFFLYPESRITIPNTFRLSQALFEFQPDIIHLMTECNMGLAGLYYGKKLELPIISTYTTNYSQYTNYYKLKFMEQSIWNYLRWFHGQCDLTLCPSNSAKNLLQKSGISNTEIFSRGINGKNFSPSLKNPSLRKQLGILGKIAFLYVGRISAEKDLDILIESYNKIYQKYGDQVALILTGDGPYRKKCESLLPDNVIFTGFKEGKELAEIYASCDIFICPSSTETFGNVVLEALSSGLAVIGANSGGIGEILIHKKNGLKFQARDAIDLTACMTELIEDIDLRDYLKESAREYGLNHSWDKIFENLIDNYNMVLEKKSPNILSA